jgi:hypothetical protein
LVWSWRRTGAAAIALVVALGWSGSVSAETLAEALASAYTNNSDLNAARAQVRAADEGVPQALSHWRPTITSSIDYSSQTGRSQTFNDWIAANNPRGISLTIEQPLFVGMRTKNGVKMAHTAVLAAREQLKSSEAAVLLDAVQAFMSVVRAQVVLNLTAQNIEFLKEQVQSANDRLSVGEGTKTDVAQANSRLATGQSDYDGAVADLNSAIAVYEQVIGHKPKNLGASNGIHKLLPKTQEDGIAIALRIHPEIVAALYNIDIASYNVKIAEGYRRRVAPADPRPPGQAQPSGRRQRGGDLAGFSGDPRRARHPDLSGRRDRLAGARIQGDPRAEADRARFNPGADQAGVHFDLGVAARLGGAGDRGRVGSVGAATCAFRRHRGAEGRAADDPRRPQFAARPAECPGAVG